MSKTLKDAIESYLKDNQLDHKYKQYKVFNEWPAIVGEFLARKTEPAHIKDHTLYIRVHDAALKQELHFMKGDLIIKLKAESDQQITDIKLI